MMRPVRCLTLALAAAGSLFLSVGSLAAVGAEPSPAYREGLRRTLELRKQRRRAPQPNPVGVIVPYPFPPALIIRQTPEVHGEIEALLGALRRSSG